MVSLSPDSPSLIRPLLVVGLGNPGSEYAKTRHNVGWMVLDGVADELALKFSSKQQQHCLVATLDAVTLLKPQLFMNASGDAVRAYLAYFHKLAWNTQREQLLTNLFVVHDDLDIPLGSHKLQFGTGPKDHNGVLSMQRQLGSDQFWHVRIGIDARGGVREMPSSEYVLSKFSPKEKTTLESVLNQARLDLLVRWGLRSA